MGFFNKNSLSFLCPKVIFFTKAWFLFDFYEFEAWTHILWWLLWNLDVYDFERWIYMCGDIKHESWTIFIMILIFGSWIPIGNCVFWESVCYKHVDVEYLRYFEWFDLLVLMELFWTRVWKKSTTWLILIDGKHDGSRCIFIYYWNCFVVDCLWNDLS